MKTYITALEAKSEMDAVAVGPVSCLVRDLAVSFVAGEWVWADSVDYFQFCANPLA